MLKSRLASQEVQPNEHVVLACVCVGAHPISMHHRAHHPVRYLIVVALHNRQAQVAPESVISIALVGCC